jgi:hypothetical protein
MKFEASRPDATATSQGTTSARVCSKTGVRPWTSVKQPEAEAACVSIGARLCTEQEWHRACSVVNPITYPVAEPAGDGKIVLEAEAYFAQSRATDPDDQLVRSWVPDGTGAVSGTGTFSGISALRASPENDQSNDATELTESPRLDYQVNFTQTGNHRVWVRMFATGNINNTPRADNRIFVGINTSPTAPATPRTLTAIPQDPVAWTWVQSGNIGVPATGVRTVSIWMGTDGAKVDALMVVRSGTGSDATPTDMTPPGNTWAYQNTPNNSQPTVCNGDAFDTDPGTAGDQDDVIATGTRPQCNANWPGGQIFDLSGNVREWTAERQPGANPIRGGASNAIEDGLRCNLAFTLANDTFVFPNVGFRCCR